jgi:hypothetical protein
MRDVLLEHRWSRQDGHSTRGTALHAQGSLKRPSIICRVIQHPPGPTSLTPVPPFPHRRHNFTHNRFVSATAAPLDNLNLDHDASGSRVDLSSLWIDLRPFMNRSPFVVRKDCSASRAHQAFVSLGLRHLMVVDTHNRVVRGWALCRCILAVLGDADSPA